MSNHPLARRLPFFYGWIIVAVAFVTMAVGVNARTAFSLFFPPILDEFHWDRGLAAGAFSFGFFISAIISPLMGRAMDRHGPRPAILGGAIAIGAGLMLATLTREPWQLYATLGVLVGGGVNCLGYTAQSLYLPNWFVRNRALAIGIAFSGVGLGSITILPWLQIMIDEHGWRAACWALGILVLALLLPLNLLVFGRPRDVGLEPDGVSGAATAAAAASRVVDQAWAATDWTLARAMRTQRFWWLAIAFFCALWSWYAVQVHQTKYLVEIGFDAMKAAWALGLVSAVAIPGQIGLGHLSDRIGRELVWVISCMGFVICYAALIAMQHVPSDALLWTMILAQGALGYGMTSVMGAIVAEIFHGRHYGAIFGTLTLASIGGGAAAPWATGRLYDATGSYALPFWIAMGLTLLSALAMWLAAPRKIRMVAGRTPPVAAAAR